jgi:16S rRNA (cytidine1402-2'-O)-methyltransferase
VVYESPARLVDTLGVLESLGAGERRAVVAREMTKQFEDVRRGTLSELRAYYGDTPPKGEIVLVIDAAPAVAASDELVRERVRSMLASGLSVRDAASAAARELGVSRKVAYRLAQEEK